MKIFKIISAVNNTANKNNYNNTLISRMKNVKKRLALQNKLNIKNYKNKSYIRLEKQKLIIKIKIIVYSNNYRKQDIALKMDFFFKNDLEVLDIVQYKVT